MNKIQLVDSRISSQENDKSEIFSSVNLPSEIRDSILGLGELRDIKSQQNIIDIGECCTESFWVLDGAFICQYFEEESEVERTVNFHIDSFHPFMISAESYFYNTRSKYRIKAVCQSKVLVFKRSVINKLIETDQAMKELYISGLTSVLIAEIKLRSKLITLPADKFYSYLITNYPQIIQHIPSKYIAEFMGISQEWLCKIKRR